jgi:hypothetical protein
VTSLQSKIETLERQLNDSSPAARSGALAELVSLSEQNPDLLHPAAEVANMHCHTFFSFNAYGYSPSGLAWLAKRNGYGVMGIVDFDVLDGVEEFLDACQKCGVRGSAGVETRVYLPEFASREMNSPGEPGIYYHMGIGFTSSRAPGEGAPILEDMRRRAEQRNRQMIARINAHLSPLSLDYERDVLPLTPAGNATERHMLAAYLAAAVRRFGDPAPFWAEKLKMPAADVAAQINDAAKFQNTMRAKLMKRGGAGYAQPGPDTFPTLEEVNRMIVSCGALPCATWLDGISEGEQAIEELLNLQIEKGAAALNIVPDRNWNLADPEVKRVKVRNLYQVVELASRLDLPLNIGTEMNAPGQRLMDDFDAPELAPVREAFLLGADFVYGHTLMQRALGLGYQSGWTADHLKTRRARNEFYARMGRCIPPTQEGLERVRRLTPASSPAEFENL